MGSSLDEESSLAASEVDIVSAVNSLQVSDTPRPDGIPVSFYKDNIQDLIPHLKMLYERIHRGAFNCSEKHFNETVKSPHDNSQQFFNVDYLIIATILARSLEDVMASLPKGRILKDSATLMIIPKTHYALISLSHVKDELKQQKQSNPTLSQDLVIIENLLSDANQDFSVEKYKVLHQACPLTTELITLALKSYGSQIFGHLENVGVFIFKQSVIVCFQPEDLDKVKATMEDSTNELYEMEILSRGNDELLQLNCLGNDCKDEDFDEWDMEESLINKENCPDERDDGTENKSKIYLKDEPMDLDVRSISATPEEEMKRNTPPLLPVPSSSTTSYGTKRKRDLESSDWSIETPLTTDMIMEKARQILQRINKSDQIDKDRRKKAIIGIFGKSGQGKSSLLSAILGKKDLLPSGCFGACTAVVTQVEANMTDSNYTAEIEFISKTEWEEELKDMVGDLKDENEDRNEDFSETAVEKITALYGADADQKTLEELQVDEKFAEIKSFLSLRKKIISNSDVSKFASDVGSFIQHSASNPGGWFWPLVKSVTIKIPDCHELLEHIVLVDLPGTGDCNKIRNDLWKSKLAECSFVWIVNNIQRAITDREPWGMLKHCIEELGPGGKCKGINFICTKTDDMNQQEYMRSIRLPKDQIPKDKDQKRPCILHRNELDKTRVKEKFDNSEIKKIFNTENQFQVFTVSSKAFFDHNLNLESSETEIPKLQDDLRNLNKSINRELARDYVNKAKGAVLLVQSGLMKIDKKMIEIKVSEFKNNLKESLDELDEYFDSIYNDLERHLSEGVKESIKSCVASTTELITPNKTRRGFHKVLGALCKNYGYYWSKNREEFRDLNKTLAKKIHKCIYSDFCQIFPVAGKTGKSVQEQIDQFSIIQNDSAYLRSDVLHYIQNFIQTEEIKLKAALNIYIVDSKKQIHSSVQLTIMEEMATCYKRAAAVKGTGSLKRMQDLLITTVDEKKQIMFNKAKMEMLKSLTDLKLMVKGALEKHLQEAIERSQSQTSKKSKMDFSREVEELETLLQQLSDKKDRRSTGYRSSRQEPSRHPAMAQQGAKRKRHSESCDSDTPLTIDVRITMKAKEIMKRVRDNSTDTICMHKDIISKISKMNSVNRKKKTIGIFGKSGEGKSFLLSAILGKENLLPSGCFGACTAVITQVEANMTDSNYTAEIELISKEEWEKELSHLHTILSNKNEDEELVIIAKEKITALYGEDAFKKTLEELKNDDKYAEIKTQKISKRDVSEFADEVARFIQNSAVQTGGWFWPLVKSVTIKIPDRRELLEHIVLVDIPGTGDCNKTRDDLWKSKLRECSSVWIVSNINRAITDRNPLGLLKHCIEELGPGGECKNIKFICTKTDDIDPTDFKRDPRVTGLQDKKQIKMCIHLRNECAKKSVKEKFENSEIKKSFSTDNDFLQVFTVSSKAFFDASLNLESAETEIPKLQDDLRSLNKSINRELARDYVNEAKGVLSLIQSVQLDKDKKAAEMKDSIIKELRNNLEQELSNLDRYFVCVYKVLDQRLSQGVKESETLCVESTKTLITPIAYNSLEALCRKGGCHCPKNKDIILDLNKTLAKPLHQFIDDDFRQIFSVSGITEKSVYEQLGAFTIIHSHTAYPRSPIWPYIHYFIKSEETKLIAELKREIVDKKKEVFSSIQKTIENEMSFCYKQAAAMKGPGSLKRMKALLLNTVDDMKKDMFDKAKTEMLKKCDELKLHIKARLDIGLKRAMDLSLSQSSTSKSMDVSREIEELDGLLEQLSD
ncbi:uncharacterized protein LOC122323324 [Puntigrus tetrazona]|uniref:uncharacterized protein LOC122323324 n=1 Tax=Puntigrus tetrazona TaxID=1606681 RepID=UPI001C8AA725|nr:uncharacterized protein LOC122323324 [Puntigrus tetrazona]